MIENSNLCVNTTNKTPEGSYLNLYFATVADFSGEFYPQERQKEIDAVMDKGLKVQKKTSWKLLEFAIDTLGKKIEEFSFEKVNGKWILEDFCFSISHSENLVCVGISDAPIGVDIESYNNFLDKVKNPFKFFDKIATDWEKKLYKSPSIGRLFKLWTGKESNFKRGNSGVFVPNKIEIDLKDTKYACVVRKGENFSVTGLSGYEMDFDFLSIQEDERYMFAVCSGCEANCNLYYVDLNKNTKVRL